MNTKKHKNKNRANKPVNPVSVTKTENPVESAELNPDTVLEERVPELISDITLSENVEISEPSDNSPQKPKRNRGKKKKDKEDLTEKVKLPENEPDMSDLIIVTAEPIKLESSENKDISVVSLEPVSRKKKGKDKAKSHQNETTKALTNEDTQLLQDKDKPPVEHRQHVDVSETESKSAKKNKKKSKKRNDSEKSDKTDDIFCTAAFQEILQSDKKDNIIMKENISDSSVSEPTVKEVDSKAKSDKKILDPEYEKNVDEEKIIMELNKNETTQPKKKNKKDKKQQSAQDMAKNETTTPETDKDIITFKDEKAKETETVNIDVQKVLEFKSLIMEDNTTLVQESTPKQKAKIAKPVERKNKQTGKDIKEGETENQTDKNEDNINVQCTTPENKPEILENLESVSVPENITKTCTEQQEIKITTTDNASKNKTGRKGKKSPKPQETVDVSTPEPSTYEPKDKPPVLESLQIELVPEKIEPVEIETFLDSATQDKEIRLASNESKKINNKKGKKSTNQTQDTSCKIIETKPEEPISIEEVREEIKSEIDDSPMCKAMKISSSIQMEEIKSHLDLEEIVVKDASMVDHLPDKNISHKEHLPVIEEIPSVKPLEAIEVMNPVEEQLIVTQKSEEKENLELEFSDFELVKKRKKSPKPNKPKPQDDLTKSLFVSDEKQVLEPNIEAQNTVKVIDKSLKEGIGDEKAPEKPTDSNKSMIVDSPRSASADITDSNNNAIIQEIGLTDIAVIQKQPNIMQSNLEPAIPNIIALPYESLGLKTIKPGNLTKEKTDLKSKVIEVNEDVEGLRLSIEKSLAEFAALEQKDTEIEANVKAFDTLFDDIPKTEVTSQSQEVISAPTEIKLSSADSTKSDIKEMITADQGIEPVAPARKDNKKGKSKKNKTHSTAQTSSQTQSESTMTETSQPSNAKNEDKSDKKTDTQSSKEEKGKQQSDFHESETKDKGQHDSDMDPIDNFEDALTSSVDDVNRTFEMIVKDVLEEEEKKDVMTNPIIAETEPDGTNTHDQKKADEKQNTTVAQPKNLLGQPKIPARSNKTDYKKEKNKTPNTKQAKVKIKDSSDVEKAKISKQCQTENKPRIQSDKVVNESKCVTSENDEYIYKYSFRKVFLPSNCHVCKKELKDVIVECNFCHLIFYCGQKHRDEDFPQHQAFCFAVSTITHLKGQKHIYSNIQNLSGQSYRLLRMQTILSCEKMLKRKLVPCEQELLLYPRVCADEGCREWRVGKLKDCNGCGQIFFCKDSPQHCPKSHIRWCKSYCLYQKLVVHQLTRGRLEPPLPSRVLKMERICDNINRVLADMYAEKIDMDDKQYAALTQLATAPLTAAYAHQLYRDRVRTCGEMTRMPHSTFTVHVVGAELQHEADSLGRWERFLLHVHQARELRVVLVGPELNPSDLPLELLGKVKLCADCRVDKRRVVFNFEDKKLYHDYCDSDDYVRPDLVCAFNPAISRVATYDDSWSLTLAKIYKQKVPFVLTSYTMNELQRDLSYIKKTVEFNTVAEPMFNPFASVRPDRNFISDDEMPLLFKNYCLCVLIGPL